MGITKAQAAKNRTKKESLFVCKTLNPGSDEALGLGCTCAILDNDHGIGNGPFWISGDCPMHYTKEVEIMSNFGKKDDSEKLRYDLLPVEPLKEVAKVFTTGAAKYGANNWKKGMQWSRLYGALQRHANAWWGGERYDVDNGQHHLSSVVFNALALMEYERTHADKDDRNQ